MATCSAGPSPIDTAPRLYHCIRTTIHTPVFAKLDPRSSTPLYAQIANRLKVAIAAGELRPAVALPSVRQLAAQLRVNPATVVQAYRDLEADGFVEMRQGAGTFVREVAPEGRARERARQAATLVRHMIAEAGRLGLSLQELQAAIAEEIGVGTP
jgi:GntR family transcriptional regulator